MQTRTRKILRDITSNWLRTVLVSASIFIGVVGVIALLTVRDLITSQLADDVKTDELAMFEIDVTLSSGSEVDNDAVLALLNQNTEASQSIAALDSIEIVEAQGLYPVNFVTATGTEDEAELRTYSSLLQDVQLEPMRLTEGRWPDAGNQELVIETRFADRFGVQVNETLELIIGQRQVTFQVVGLVFHPYSYKRPSSDGSITPGPEDGIYIQSEDAALFLQNNGYTRIVVRYDTFENAEANYEAFQNVLRTETPYLPKFPLIENPAENGQIQNIEAFGNILSLLAVVGMVVSGFLVVNVINTIVAEQKQQIGILKSIGATEVDNFFIYAGIALGYGVIGSLAALIPGVLLGYELSQTLGPQLDVLIEDFQWSPASVGVGLIMGIVVPILASAIPVYNGTRVTILEAVTDLGIDTGYGTGFFAKLIGRLPVPTLFRQAISNIFQKKGRLVLTGLTLTSAIGASMGIIAMGRSLNNGVTDIFDRLDYQITVLPSDVQRIQEAEQVILNTEGISSAQPGTILTVQIEADYINSFTRNSQVITFGIDPATNPYRFQLESGEGWTNDSTIDGVIMAAPMATQIGAQVGDEISFFVGGNYATKTIIGIEDTAFDAMWMPWYKLAEIGGFFTDGPQPNTYSTIISVENVNGFTGALGIDANVEAVLNNGDVLPTDSVVVTEALATAGNFTVGDTILVTIDDTATEHEIAAIVPQADFDDIAAAQGNTLPIQNVVFFPFTELLSLTGADTGQTPAPNGFYVSINRDNPSSDDVDDSIADIEANLVDAGLNAEILNQVERFNEISDLILQYTAILSLAAVLIAAVGAVGLLTTLTITVLERQKEIGVMRSIGASSYTIASQFLIEGVLVGIMAWFVGIPISYLLALQINAAFQLETVKFTYPPEVLVFGLVGMLVIASIASLGPSLSAARKTVSEILRYQ